MISETNSPWCYLSKPTIYNLGPYSINRNRVSRMSQEHSPFFLWKKCMFGFVIYTVKQTVSNVYNHTVYTRNAQQECSFSLDWDWLDRAPSITKTKWIPFVKMQYKTSYLVGPWSWNVPSRRYLASWAAARPNPGWTSKSLDTCCPVTEEGEGKPEETVSNQNKLVRVLIISSHALVRQSEQKIEV